ncbi:MAG: PKD domain-containing protein, partial [Candidatus Thermoplasmatota archaeon]|nr:PKD domain-containing protein [Candidatus Thermoplasmatota archaeon]
NSLLSILSWVGGDPDGDNVTYDVYFGMNMTPALVSNNQTITTYDPGVLNDNTTYYWHIIAFDDENLSAAGPLWEFTTRINSPPGIPTTPYPSHNSSGVGINVDLSWFCGDPDGDPLTYDVYFGTTTNPPQIANNITTIPYDIGQLNVLTTYYWYIVAWDPYGLYSTGPLWKFTTQANTAPSRPVITHGPHAAGPGIAINFSAISSDPEGDSIFYQWDWGDGNLSIWYGPYNLSDEPIVNYTWFFSDDYQVKVKAKDTKNAESPWSKTHNITIESQIFISNLDPGFIYFDVFIFNRSYMFIYALSVLGVTAMISTAGFEAKATFSDAVEYVIFDAFNPVWGESIVVTDTNLSDGAQAYMSLTNGLWQVRAYAYDSDDIMIDEDMHYLLFIGAGQGGGQTIGSRTQTLRERLSNRILK